MIHIDPVTRQRVLVQDNSGDFVYEQTGDPAISQEVVPVIGKWEDYTGSGGPNSRNQQMWAGVENELQGTDPGIQGEDSNELDITGNTKKTTRRRNRKVLCKKS